MSTTRTNAIHLKDKTKSTTVPDNDVARLMYYLACVFSVIEYKDDDLDSYQDYENWDSLSFHEVRYLLFLCWTFSPDEFEDKVFFHSDDMSGNVGNKFYEITQIRQQVVAVGSITIAGRSCQVNQIMTYNMSWMQRNYFGPIQRLFQRIIMSSKSS